MAKADPIRVRAAMVSGTTARYVRAKVMDEAAALAEIEECLRGLKAEQRQRALDYAAAGLSGADPGAGGWWYPAGRELLARAGADLERAVAIASTYRGGFTVAESA